MVLAVSILSDLRKGLIYNSIIGRGADMLNCQHNLQSGTMPVIG